MAEPLPLRDIHLPDPVSWFPPAPGWWIASGIALLLGYLAWRWLRQSRNRVLNKSAVAEIDAVIQDYSQHGDRLQLFQQLSIVLKRIGMSYFSRDEVAGLSGVGWIERLNSLVHRNQLPAPQVALLATLPYQKASSIADEQVQEILAQIRRWALSLPRAKRESSDV